MWSKSTFHAATLMVRNKMEEELEFSFQGKKEKNPMKHTFDKFTYNIY